MLARLPETLDPLRYAEAGRILEGRIAIAKMRRLATLLHEAAGEAEVALNFGVDLDGTRNVQGTIKAAVVLICQRCLAPMTLPVRVSVSLGVVGSEAEAERLSGHYDPLLVGEDPVSLTELVEDELILALPVVACHELGGCHAAQTDQQEPVTDDERPNPFAVLEQLKRD